MNSSESGRKLNQAVNTTSKAVGGALSQAKGAFSNFWSAFTTPTTVAEPTTPTINQPSNKFIDEIAPTIADEVMGIEQDETREKSLNGRRTQTHDTNQLEEDIKGFASFADPGINDTNERIVEIAKEADTFDSNGQNNLGQVFDT